MRPKFDLIDPNCEHILNSLLDDKFLYRQYQLYKQETNFLKNLGKSWSMIFYSSNGTSWNFSFSLTQDGKTLTLSDIKVDSTPEPQFL
jgi:hypothetical protein